MNRTRRVLSIGDVVPYLRYMQGVGVEMLHIQSLNRLNSLQDLSLPIHTIISPLEDSGRVLDLAKGLHQAVPFDAVVSFTELGLSTAAQVAHSLGLPTNPLEAIILTRNKHLMRNRMAECGIPSIRYRLCHTPEEVITLGADIGYPLIMKPVDGWASISVFKVNHAEEVHVAFAATANEWNTASAILAEEYVEGDEVSVEAFSVNGEHHIITITDKVTTGAPRFVELGHSMPSQLAPAVQDQIRETVRRFLTAVHVQMGPSHTELRIGPNGPVVIESHTRPGGDFIAYMMELAFGVEMIGLTVRHMLGEEVDPRPSRSGAAAVRYFRFPSGTVQSVEGVEDVRDLPGVAWVDFHPKPGDVVQEPTNSFDRHGCVVVTANTPKEAIARAEQALACVQVRVTS